MKKVFFTLMVVLMSISAVSMAMGMYPGFGAGISVDGGTTFNVGGHLGLTVHPMFSVVMESHFHTTGYDSYYYTGRVNAVSVGGGMDIFILHFKPHKLIIDPYVFARGGYGRTFGDYGGNGGYVRFGGGVPFVLDTIMPYAEIGAVIEFNGGTDIRFNLMGGIRFNL